MKIQRDMTFTERQVAFATCCGMPLRIAAEAMGITVPALVSRRGHLFKYFEAHSSLEFALKANAAVRDAYRQGFAR